MKSKILLSGLATVIFAIAGAARDKSDLASANSAEETKLLTIDSGRAKVGIDRSMGAAITWLSSVDYPDNMVNHADPGRLIQQSYYAGKGRNRTGEGQYKNWSPWVWNPIQGGGVGSWARVSKISRTDREDGGFQLFSETIPKLWDMHDEEAAAVMRQWTKFEPGMPEVVVVECEFVSNRQSGDRWGPAVKRHQELPALYFTRSFGKFQSYLGDSLWRVESQPPGPPWGKAEPPENAMACFNSAGNGVAVFSPAATDAWNFGPHGGGESTQPAVGPCVHVAPIAKVALEPKSTLRYRYWLIVGDEATIAGRLDELKMKYGDERVKLTTP